MSEPQTPVIHGTPKTSASLIDYSTTPPTLICPSWCTEGQTHDDGSSHTHKHTVTVPAGAEVTCRHADGSDPREITVVIEQYVTFDGTPLVPKIHVNEIYFELSEDDYVTTAGAVATIAALSQALAIVQAAGSELAS